MKYIGVDIGVKKSGLSVSDKTASIAKPVKVVPTKQLIDEIFILSVEHGTQNIVLGDPVSLTRKENEISLYVKSIKDDLKNRKFEVFLEPEYYSSKEVLRFGGDDSNAAAVILQSFLDKLT